MRWLRRKKGRRRYCVWRDAFGSLLLNLLMELAQLSYPVESTYATCWRPLVIVCPFRFQREVTIKHQATIASGTILSRNPWLISVTRSIEYLFLLCRSFTVRLSSFLILHTYEFLSTLHLLARSITIKPKLFRCFGYLIWCESSWSKRSLKS